MNAIARTERKDSSWKRLFLPMGLGAVAGYSAMRLAGDSVDGVLASVPSDHLAGLGMGLLSLVVALACMVGSFFPASVARSYGVPVGDDVREETSLQRWSALCAAFYAAFMLAIGFSSLLVPALVWAVTIAALLGAIATNAYLWHRYDELWRQITAQACVITFTLFHYVLMAWVALAVLTGWRGLYTDQRPLDVAGDFYSRLHLCHGQARHGAHALRPRRWAAAQRGSGPSLRAGSFWVFFQ